MSPNYPASLDNGTTLPSATDTSSLTNPDLATVQNTQNAAVIALESKLGIGASTPVVATVLRGTGTGTSAYEQVSLSTDVTGVLSIANGGTESSIQNFVDLTTAQNVAGAKTFTDTLSVNAALYLNATAYLDGSTQGEINFFGNTFNINRGGAHITGNGGTIFKLTSSGIHDVVRFDDHSVTFNASSGYTLYLSVSTTSAPSLNIPPGTAPTTPNTGDLYSDGTHLYIYLASAWKTII